MERIPNTLQMLKVKTILGRPADTPIYFAPHDFPLSPSPADIRRATPLSHTECVYAQTCKRLLGYVALVYRRVAYVPQMGAHGRELIYKYGVSDGASERLRDFDRTGGIVPHMVLLKAIPPSWKPAAQAEYRKAREARARAGIAPKKQKRHLARDVRLPWGA